MAGGGYIKIHRQILEWEWYGDINTKVVFLHLLLIASWEDNRFQGIDIPRGSAVCSHSRIAEETGLTINKVRTALNHLQHSGEITITRRSKFLVISLTNYDKYQCESQSNHNQNTIISQSNHNQITTLKNNKNIRNKEINYMCGNDGASYDIKKAVADASTTVPTLTKREKR